MQSAQSAAGIICAAALARGMPAAAQDTGRPYINLGVGASFRRIVWLIGLALLLAGCGALTRTDDSNPRAGAQLKHPWEVDPHDPTQRYN
jgi:hypothetical protein